MIKEELMKLLEETGYPAVEQGSYISEKEMPQHFFTLWNYDTESSNYYSNKNIFTIWYFWIEFHSTDPLLPEKIVNDVIEKLHINNWIVDGKGYDIETKYNTYSARHLDIKYIEKEN